MRWLRLPWILARLCWFALAGAALRQWRRLRRKPPRIWHGMFHSHLIPLQVASDRDAGFPSRSVVTRVEGSYELVSPDAFTRVLQASGVPNEELLWAGYFDLLLHGDIWVSFYDGLFYPLDREWENRALLRLLKLVGIRIAMVNYGGDIVSWGEHRGRYDWISRLGLDYPHWDIRAGTTATQRRIALFHDYADFVCNGDSSIDRQMPKRDLVWKYFPVDTARIRPPATHAANAVPKIVHAPQHRNVKGTDFLLASAERLRARGFEFELQLVEKVPNREALALYAQADVIADQFCIGAWGAFAQESLALGKPVLTYLDEEHLRDPAFNLPLVNTTPENMDAVLAALIRVPELRERLGRAGREAIERFQSVAAVGEVWAHIYRHLWWGDALDLASTACFDPGRPRRFLVEDPALAEFWPVAVDDLLSAIAAAVEEARA